jgi:ATP-dependent Clp protease protease subunit
MFDYAARARGLQLLARANRGRGEFRADTSGPVPTIFVYDVIVASEADAEWYGGVAANTFVRALMAIDAPAIDVRVNSPGGDVFAAVAMSHAIRNHKATITVHVDGYAASAASILMVNADRAVIAPGGFVMIHNAWTIALGSADDFRATADLLDKIDASAAAQYAAKAGNAPGDWTALIDAETWFTADEALAAKLVDGIAATGPKGKIDWDVSAYANAPAPRAADPAVADAAPAACTVDAPCGDPACDACKATADVAAAEAERTAAQAVTEREQRQRQTRARLLPRTA